MSELASYNSSSGSYDEYLKKLQKTTELSTAMNVSSAAHVATKIDNASLKIQQGLAQNTQALASVGQTMIASTAILNNTMQLGFSQVSSQLGKISCDVSAGFARLACAIEKMSNEICSRLDEIHDIVNNPLLTASRELYRRAVKNTQAKFYEEALEDIIGAVEKNKTDYISWFLEGQLYLFGCSEFSDVVNPQKAELAFLNTVKYATADLEVSSDAKKLSAEAYFYLSYARYILANESKLKNKKDEQQKYLEDSVQSSLKSYALSNNITDALYNAARCNVFLNKKTEALKFIEQLIKLNRDYVIRISGDSDFDSIRNEIYELILKLQSEIKTDAKNLQKKILEYNNDFEFKGGDYAETILKFLHPCLSISQVSDETPYYDLRVITDNALEVVKLMDVQEFPPDMLVYEGGEDDFDWSKWPYNRPSDPPFHISHKLYDGIIITDATYSRSDCCCGLKYDSKQKKIYVVPTFVTKKAYSRRTQYLEVFDTFFDTLRAPDNRKEEIFEHFTRELQGTNTVVSPDGLFKLVAEKYCYFPIAEEDEKFLEIAQENGECEEKILWLESTDGKYKKDITQHCRANNAFCNEHTLFCFF